jgi:hypothetical protein
VFAGRIERRDLPDRARLFSQSGLTPQKHPRCPLLPPRFFTSELSFVGKVCQFENIRLVKFSRLVILRRFYEVQAGKDFRSRF